MKLTDREWKEFKVGKLFTVEKCKCANASLLNEGDLPYVGATNKNNGTMSFVKATSNHITKGNCIVFICDGQGSVGYSIYKKESFIGSTTLKVGRSNFLNKYNALFFTTALDKNRSIYSYGYKRNENRLKNEHIMLPINEQGQPDYQFMEDYIKEMMYQKRKEYIDYANKKIEEKRREEKRREEIEPLHSKKWKEFNIAQLFDIYSGKRLESYNQQLGNRPFIGATDSNNGITNFISNTNSSLDENVLGVNYNGSVVCSYYHPYKCLFSDDVKRFHLKNKKDRKDILLFFSTVIYQQREKYRYAYKFNSERMKRQYIMLPINDNNEPDYEYMEDYMQTIILNKYNDYIQYSNQKIQSLTN